MIDATDITVAIATTNRRAVLGQTVRHLAGLQDKPAALVLSLAGRDDVDQADLEGLPFPLTTLTGPAGLCAQRNRVLDRLEKSGHLLFVDDDFLLADGSLSALKAAFASDAEIALATGAVVADGIHGPGISVDAGLAMLRDLPPVHPGQICRDVFTAYGCNMAVDLAALHRAGLRFDERLPLYGWLEDYDFSRRMARYGRVVAVDGMRGVHLGTKSGRVRGTALGYSQIANPLYLMRKGSLPRRKGLTLMTRNILANLTWPLRSEPYLDRRGRALGNRLALLDLLRGRLAPEGATQILASRD